ncbi:hypothetical protein [Streptomyces sp. NPDC002952]|uniref:hypothetical protein n=1 Tax=Streptomyces sp. NPDC002952 TaxID=3364673 RepID=UPI0036B69130
MPDQSALRHNQPGTRRHSNPDTAQPSSRPAFTLISDAADHGVHTTASRRLRHASDFLAAVQWMIAGGYHPKASRTTLRVAEVLAARMHRSRDGHVPFSVQATADELGLHPRSVYTHARYLRELGLLTYVVHGSKINALRTRRGANWTRAHGYRGTATIFAPTAPPAWDHAMGRRIEGRGYTARQIGLTASGREHAIEEARHRAAAKKTARRRRCTPSVVVPTDDRQPKEVGGSNYTVRKRTRPSRRLQNSARPRISPAACAYAISVAEKLRRAVWWLYRGCARRVGYALRPLIAAGWTTSQLAAEVATWGVPPHLKDPAAYLRYELHRRQQLNELPHTELPAHSPAIDDGSRYQAMLRDRAAYASTFRRYAEQTRAALRDELASRRRQREQTATPAYRPTLREPEEVFLASLPADTWADAPSPREIYAARARGHKPSRGRELTTTSREALRRLHEHTEAARVCNALRQAWSERRQQDPEADTP